MSAVLAEAQDLGGTIVKMIAVLALVAALLAAWVSRVVTGPLRAVVQATEAFSQGMPHGALPVERLDELGELARGFRDMEAQIGQQMDELNRSRDAMTHLAHHDPLTGFAQPPHVRAAPGAGLGPHPPQRQALRAGVCRSGRFQVGERQAGPCRG
jgi:HAMP domain-containing protein